MKFNCGKSRATKIQEAEDLAAKMNAEYKAGGGWIKAFAWLPVRISDEDCRWLEHYEFRNSEWAAFHPEPGEVWGRGKEERRPLNKETTP